MGASAALLRVDHLVYATADLACGIAEVERLLGIRASLGGQHRAWGTCNALVALGPRSYLEIIAPYPEPGPISGGRPFGLDEAGPSRLVAWGASGGWLHKIWDAAAQHGVDLGAIQSGSRERPDGTVLTWELTDLRCVVAGGVVPFFIDWGTSTHPALAAPKGATLVELRVEHPDADRVRRILRVFALDLPVNTGPAPAVIAKISCPNGCVVLR
jgi:hypothetical protein